jgi:hypothetical protein
MWKYERRTPRLSAKALSPLWEAESKSEGNDDEAGLDPVAVRLPTSDPSISSSSPVSSDMLGRSAEPAFKEKKLSEQLINR